MATTAKIADITLELEKASERLREAEREESAARCRATSLRNEVNQLQKKFDAAVVETRNAAGTETDWGVRRRSGQSMSV